IGWIGLGTMGSAMAQNLQKHRTKANLSPIAVYNRTQSKCDALVALGAHKATSISGLKGLDIIFLSLFNGDAVKSTIEEILLSAHTPDKRLIICDTTTVHPTVTKWALDRMPDSVEFVQTPVWGAPPAAKAAALVLVTSAHHELIRDIGVPAFARTTIKVSNPVRAAEFKILGNFMVAAVIESLGEAFAVAHEVGISRETFFEFVKEMFPVAPFIGYGTKLVADDGNAAKHQVGFTVVGGMKDVGYAIDVAKGAGMRLPIAELAYEHLEWVKENGSPDWDWSSLAYALRKES
ncbi:hypothetical protein BX070DRAFT_184915, partial [Coemansia spiralis]